MQTSHNDARQADFALCGSRGGSSNGGPRRRDAAITASVAAAAAALVGGVAVAARMARLVVTPTRNRENLELIQSVDEGSGTVTLSATVNAPLPGRYGLCFGSNGYARLGELTARSSTTVTRRILSVDEGELRAGVRGDIASCFYTDPRELGLPVQDVTVAGPVGPLPAWRIDPAAPSGGWVIYVHGRGTARPESIRAVPTFFQAGLTSLIISYRNDAEAPASPDGRYGLGATEWQDVNAALEYAVANGATDVVLMGWSMGGAICLQTVSRAPLRHLIRGMVLDSPVINWIPTLQHHGDGYRLPSAVTRIALTLISRPWGRRFTGQAMPIDLAALNWVARASELTVPTLILHSADDDYVPVAASRELARLRGDVVTYVEFTTAGHTKLWNFDPERWTSAISSWLEEQHLTEQHLTEQRLTEQRQAPSRPGEPGPTGHR